MKEMWRNSTNGSVIFRWIVPCVGRKFTWYKSNGTAKSRLDRILVLVEWFANGKELHSSYWKETSLIFAQSY